jgi:hypothetical protein
LIYPNNKEGEMVTVDVTATNQEVDEFFAFCQLMEDPKIRNTAAAHEMRYGQYVFNRMETFFPDLANFFRGSFKDCFYLDENVAVFLDECRERFMAIYDVEG